jgi:hypothetical protein
VSRARHTSPIAPAPSAAVTSYVPSLDPGESPTGTFCFLLPALYKRSDPHDLRQMIEVLGPRMENEILLHDERAIQRSCVGIGVP